MSTADTTERRIADRYVLHQSLGRGGMGVVWRAYDTLLNRAVAVKEIRVPRQLSEAEAQSVQARAMREARSAARLTHPAVVTIYDVVQEESQSFIVMEFVDAPTLEDLVTRKGPLRPDDAAQIGLDLVDALQTAHSNGIVHRDVKPSNVMITEDGRAKLADFGIASVKDDPKITSTGMILGSPQFMAPEQAKGTTSGPEADLWALGATLYFAVEGRYPFDRGEAIPTLAAVVHDEFAPMRRAGWLTPVIGALLDKRPERRPSDAQLRRMLEPTVAAAEEPPPGVGPTVRQQPDPATAHPEVAERMPESQPLRPEPRVRSGWPASLLIVLLLLGVAAAIFFVFLRDNDPEAPSATGGGEQTQPGETEEGAGGGTDENTETSGEGTQPTGSETEPTGSETDPNVAVPSDWATYRDPGSGYQLAYPAGWQLVQDADNSIDFRDPQTGTYLRVQWTTTPGPSPEGAWETQAESFGASHSGYEEIGITPTTYKGHDAALWEFKYEEGGAQLHAADLGFVIGDDYGFALYFQTHEQDWAASQVLFEQLKTAFRPPRV